ncbi:nuclease-related domain-containing protein [Streptomyces chilikensis]|uniref:Nuclease-related domain-containing protein n=1 Tax=Streptomyces chilikensis TaxID=1194079 RepID=A0ABV3ERV0_9ACTN
MAAREAGAVGEQRTAVLLQSLELEGWAVLHDRALPGASKANADHILVSPAGLVFLVESKLWSSRWPVHGAGGELWHGTHSRHRSVRSVLFERDLMVRALGVEVTALVAVHQAPVHGGARGFVVDGVRVLPAGSLVAVLRALDGRPAPAAAAALAARAEGVFPRYVDER